MKTHTTLREFIFDMLQLCELDVTEKNFKKFRIKFTRELKNMGLWENATRELIGRKNTRVFTSKELSMLKNNSREYLAKQSKYDFEELETIGHSIIDEQEKLIESFPTVIDSQKELDQKYEESKYKWPVTQIEENNVMLKAIFDIFYTPIDKKQWEADRTLVNLTDDADDQAVMSLEHTMAVKRLRSDNMSAYYNKK